jgi:hypothetical protein
LSILPSAGGVSGAAEADQEEGEYGRNGQDRERGDHAVRCSATSLQFDPYQIPIVTVPVAQIPLLRITKPAKRRTES